MGLIFKTMFSKNLIILEKVKEFIVYFRVFQIYRPSVLQAI